MLLQLLLLIPFAVSLAVELRGQPGDAKEQMVQAPVRIRAVLHDPVRPVASLYYPGKDGLVRPVPFKPQDLSEPMHMVPVDGSLVLYDKAVIDPEKPEAGVVAKERLPDGLRQGIVVVLPNAGNEKRPYRMVIIDESVKAFPFGESRVMSLVGTNVGVQAGEHAVVVPPGKVGRIPAVRKRNEPEFVS